MSTKTTDFNVIVAGCMGHANDQAVIKLVTKVLSGEQLYDRAYLNACQRELTSLLGENDQIDLIYGGATKIKGYVFESARLPEIRGASALLDFAGIDEVRRICQEADGHVIYAGGGSFLAIAPAGQGNQIANRIERRFTELTQTALSVVVSKSFRLLELRYGRLRFGADGLVAFWLEEFLKLCPQQQVPPDLAQYYYQPPNDEQTPSAHFYYRKSFGELVTVLATMYNRRRDERMTHCALTEAAEQPDERALPLVERLPWVARCASSDHRPAVYADEIYGTLSEASARKLAVGRYVKRGEREAVRKICDAIRWQLPAGIERRAWSSQWQEYLASDEGRESCYAKHEHVDEANPASDTHQIGAAGNGFIGVIYADGNNVGRVIATLQTPQDYHKFSHKLERAAQDAVFKALSKHLLPTNEANEQGQRNWCHPFEIITIGGDDLMLIVPGDKALEIALSIGAEFERALDDQQQPRSAGGRYQNRDQNSRFDDAGLLSFSPKIGLSAGLVIAQANAPIFFLQQLVEELLKSAKKKSKPQKPKAAQATPPESGGAIDFMVLKSITMVSDNIEEFRRAALEGRKCRLTARPYSWYELAGLLHTLGALKQAGVPRSQFYRLREVLLDALDQGPQASALEYLTTRVRQGRTVADALHTHVEQSWQAGSIPNGLPPWLPIAHASDDSPKWETIWADLVELYDMFKPTSQESPHA